MKGKGGFIDAAGRASVIGLHLVSGMIVGGLIGYGIDAVFDCAPWGLLGFLLLGIAAGFRNMWRDAKAMLGFSAPDAVEKDTDGSGDAQ